MPSRRPRDPAARRAGDPEPPQLDLRAEGVERLRAAGEAFAAWLNDDPSRIDDITPVEEAAVKLAKGAGFIGAVERRYGELTKMERDAERSMKRREKYPTHDSRSLDPGATLYG